MADTNDFDDAAEFDISRIVQDIDAANLALDSLDGRANKLTETLQALLKAQSQPNPYASAEAAPQNTSSVPRESSSTGTSSSCSSSSTTSSGAKPAEQSSGN